MKNLDLLIKKASALLTNVIMSFFPGNDDEFMQALGVDPDKYKHVTPGGSEGYDFMAALNDTAPEDWDGYEQSEDALMYSNSEDDVEDFDAMDYVDEVVDEKPEITTSDQLEETKPEKSGRGKFKYSDIFGWG